MSFPTHRPRRLRRDRGLVRMVAETTLGSADLVQPMFISETASAPEPIEAMPGVVRYPVAEAVAEAERVHGLGIPAVLLFGLPATKDATGSESVNNDGVVQRAVRQLKERIPDLIVITDVCLCEYTDHGHCGVITERQVDNDATLELLARQALSHAKAGADIVAPSDMMDGRVGFIRQALDENGFSEVAIMSYAAKYCSAFYGPFREAVYSAPKFGDRSSYQMNPPNAREAMMEITTDIEEGADIVMVKPALAYLDIIYRARERFDIPVAAYNVSGEYSMVKLAAAGRLADEKRLALEVLTAIKRAGADIIVTYHAADAAEWIG